MNLVMKGELCFAVAVLYEVVEVGGGGSEKQNISAALCGELFWH
jgi:hypothetical protein